MFLHRQLQSLINKSLKEGNKFKRRKGRSKKRKDNKMKGEKLISN